MHPMAYGATKNKMKKENLMKKLLSLLLALCMMLTLLAGCGGNNANNSGSGNDKTPSNSSDTDGDSGKRDDVTVWGNMMIDNYNPIDWQYEAQNNLFESVYSTLVKTQYKDDGSVELIGDLADSWETEEDGAVWVFHLNENAKFTNGEPVTAEDVKFSFEAYAASSYGSPRVSLVKSVEARDEHTVAINIGTYSARAPWCWHQVAIVEADAYQADKDAYIKEQIGSGPYKLESLDEASGNYTLVRNDDYYGTPAIIKTVNVRVVADPSNAVIALQNGELDYMYISGTMYDLLSGDENIALKQQPSGYGNWLLLNSNVAPLDNKLLRQAIAYAVDYEAQWNLAFGGRMNEENTSVFFASVTDPLPEGVAKYTYDPEKAKELIAQSGLSTPIDIGDFYGGSGGRAELIQQNLADVGIICQPVSLENFAMLEAYQKGNYSIGMMGGVGGGYLTASDMLSSMYGTGSAYNLPHYSNPELDKMIAELDATQDKGEYDAKLKEILELIVEEVPGVCTGKGAFYSAYNKDLKVPTCNTGLVRFAELSW